jgi:hypothetical protein
MAERKGSKISFRKEFKENPLFPQVKRVTQTILENSVEGLMKKNFEIRKDDNGLLNLYLNNKLKFSNLKKAPAIWVLGGGKAGIGMAQAILRIIM